MNLGLAGNEELSVSGSVGFRPPPHVTLVYGTVTRLASRRFPGTAEPKGRIFTHNTPTRTRGKFTRKLVPSPFVKESVR